MVRFVVRLLLGASALISTAVPAIAQRTPESLPTPTVGRLNTLVESPNLPREIDPFFVPPLVLKPTTEGAASPPAAVQTLTDFRLSQTYLPKLGTNGFGINDTDFAAQVALPGWEPLGKPLLLKGGFGVHIWDGPGRDQLGRDPAIPGTVYDLYLDLGWKPRPAEWLFLDLGITAGLYTDFHAFPHEAFRLRGRALSIIALSEKFQFVLGALYVNRNALKLIPAGGFIWSPDDDTRLQVTFPQPKLARRVASFGDTGWWVYAAGEFGGGTWAYHRPDGSSNSLDYNDYRAILGTELKRTDGWLLRAEAGYVWGRQLAPLNAPQFNTSDSIMLRLALVY